MHDRLDPIIAISTAPGRGAVGVVRLSGKDLKSFGKELLKKPLKARQAQYLKILDNEDNLIDEVLFLYFESPKSYTGEDVIEIQGHGGAVVLQRIVQHCFDIAKSNDAETLKERLPNLRLARPGEFSERAFLNNKIDLFQAEAIIDLIDASTELAAKSASRSMSGAFSQEINHLLEELTKARIFIEAHIDFPEEELDDLDFQRVDQTLAKALETTKSLLKKTKNGVLLKEGIKTVIAGQPNVGKSSLMNLLCDQEVSIVTDMAGTTRDFIEKNLQVNGVAINLIDTAGIHDLGEGMNPVEQIGIDRAWSQIKLADLILLVHDASKEQDPKYLKKDEALLADIEKHTQDTPILHIWNKCDLLNAAQLNQENEQTLSEQMSSNSNVYISTKNLFGIEGMKTHILKLAGWSEPGDGGLYTARTRHVQVIERVKLHLSSAQMLTKGKDRNLELVAEELRLAQNTLSQITGEFTADDLLGEIFSKFCIGK